MPGAVEFKFSPKRRDLSLSSRLSGRFEFIREAGGQRRVVAGWAKRLLADEPAP